MKRALLVGIDSYDNFRQLYGCVNDVAALGPLLARHADGGPNFDCQLLANRARGVTGEQVGAAVARLFAPGADSAVLYVSGHGLDHQGDLAIVATDGTAHGPGITMTEILGRVARSRIPQILIILDCCFAGTAGQVPHFATENAAIPAGVVILAATRNDQGATETGEQRGLFSTMLEEALAGGAADVQGRVTISGLYAYLSECFSPWEQRPTLKANVDREYELRRCEPALPLPDLRQLPALFPTPTFELPLDPSYEPAEDPHDEQHERDFALLQRARSAKLVEPVGETHLYFAALHGRSCRLTPLGRHYRRMAEKGLL